MHLPKAHTAVTGTAPPAGLSGPQTALWWLARGGLAVGPMWETAHQIAQAQEGDRDHDLIHALTHLIEGDHANAAYWYRRAGQTPGHDPAEEWARLADLMSRG